MGVVAEILELELGPGPAAEAVANALVLDMAAGANEG